MAQQGPVADSCVHGNGPSSSIGGGGGENFLNSLVTIHFSKRTLFHGISLTAQIPERTVK
jgi:hypothetical protein